jgi:hypothetical protein
MAEENIVRHPGIPFDPVKKDWEDDIIDAPHDTPRKAVWVPMADRTTHWYISRERSVHSLVNFVLRIHMESELASREIAASSE